eukprot:scaffold169489_cov33-Prasinocladus_malaysianus.AAC.1
MALEIEMPFFCSLSYKFLSHTNVVTYCDQFSHGKDVVAQPRLLSVLERVCFRVRKARCHHFNGHHEQCYHVGIKQLVRIATVLPKKS